MAKFLTLLAIENLKPAAARREIPDGKAPGLFHIIQPSGARSWAVRYRFNGLGRKLTLGPYPALDLATARKRAHEALASVSDKLDPAAAKQEAKRAAKSAAATARVEGKASG